MALDLALDSAPDLALDSAPDLGLDWGSWVRAPVED